jgi:hypothetical protein
LVATPHRHAIESENFTLTLFIASRRRSAVSRAGFTVWRRSRTGVAGRALIAENVDGFRTLTGLKFERAARCRTPGLSETNPQDSVPAGALG